MTDRASVVLHGRIHARTAFVAAVFALGLLLVAPAVSRAAPSPDAQPGTSAPPPDPAPGAGSAPAPVPKPAAPKPAPPAPASTATNQQASAPAATTTPSEPSGTTAPAPAPTARPATRAADPPRRRARRTRRHARRDSHARGSEVSLPKLRPPVFPSAVIPLRTAADRATPSSTDEEGALRLVALVLLLLVVANLGFVALATGLRRDWTAF